MTLSSSQLAAIDETKEVLVETFSGDDSTKTIIWIVEIDGEVYVRSVRGESGRWYQRVLADPRVIIHVGEDSIEFTANHVEDAATIAAVDDALRAKYPAGGSLDRMTRPEVLGTTLRLDPVA